MEENTNSTMTMHWYPDFIIHPIHKNRCVKIIVKEAEVSLKGSWESILETYESTKEEIKTIIENSGDLWAEGKKVSDIESTNIVENTKKIRQGDPIYACCLPLPNSFIENQQHNWNQEQSMLAGMINDVKFMGVANQLVGNLTHYFGVRKPMVDPGLFQNYTGSVPRGFSLNFDFIPNNHDEAKNIMNIILNLKKFALPRSVIDGVALLAPFTFEIEIGNEYLKKIVNMNDVVITNVNVNYGADGSMQLFSNGIPKHITLQLDITERSLIPSQFYD